ncbi:MAG: pyridoxal-phosphate dependent enzyme [Sphingobacteriales bacterium]|nr:MAG: pyridoxal-phosphate dependent enzyme [Sphingobacteriales bacterium]
MRSISPLQHISFNGMHISVKRDDMIDPFISGNKWRKLKYILEDVKKAGKTHLVTFGGAYSNHLLATAAAAARNSLTSTAFVRGEVVENEVLFLCKLFGMELIFTPRDAYKDKKALYSEQFSHDPKAYFIDEGGAGKEGARGCEEILDELPVDTSHIFCAAGTGTTAAGILNGIIGTGSKAHLHIVPVLKGGDRLRETIESLTLNRNFTLHTNYHFGGYAKTTPDLILFIQEFTSKTGILIDQIYTAKMFMAIADLHKAGVLHNTDKVVAIHTGGLIGMFSMVNR